MPAFAQTGGAVQRQRTRTHALGSTGLPFAAEALGERTAAMLAVLGQVQVLRAVLGLMVRAATVTAAASAFQARTVFLAAKKQPRPPQLALVGRRRMPVMPPGAAEHSSVRPPRMMPTRGALSHPLAMRGRRPPARPMGTMMVACRRC